MRGILAEWSRIKELVQKISNSVSETISAQKNRVRNTTKYLDNNSSAAKYISRYASFINAYPCSIICYNTHPIDSTQRPLSHVGKHALPRDHPVNINRRKRKVHVRILLLKNFVYFYQKNHSMKERERERASDSGSRVKIRIKLCRIYIYCYQGNQKNN